MARVVNRLLTAGLAMWVVSAVAAPKADLWDRWTVHDANSTERVDHSAWTSFLRRHLVEDDDGLNRVDYARVRKAEKRNLERYIDTLQSVRVSALNRNEQFAYWVNLYNTLTVHLVLENYPVDSILDISISPGVFSRGPWGKALVTVEGESLSLDDIEHRILRPIWQDPRVHYAVNCAAVGCPNLAPEAFTARNMNSLLDKGARDYINSPRGVTIDSRGRLKVSSIYEWFKEDFGGSDPGVIAHIEAYASPQLATALNGTRRIADDYYDWSLNDVKPQKRSSSTKRFRGSSGGYR